MKTIKFIAFSLAFLSVISCTQKPSYFEYKITGQVIGKDYGDLYLSEMNSRVGDGITIPFENGTFVYEGKSGETKIFKLAFWDDVQDGSFRIYPIIIESGDIVVELDADSIYEKSRILKGQINTRVVQINQITKSYRDEMYDDSKSKNELNKLRKVYYDKIVSLIIENSDDFAGVYLLFLYERAFNDSILTDILDKSDFKEFRNSKYYKIVYSRHIGRQSNQPGQNVINFSLPDSTGGIIELNDVIKGKIAFIELSGSWCRNTTRQTRELIPIYEKYHEKGFEIIGVGFETKYNRWKQWLRDENFPWINLIELEDDNSNDIFISQQLFADEFPANLLVDEEGIVILRNLSSTKLDEILMEKYEPQKYKEYIEVKRKLPEETYILDREQPINTFTELTKKLSGKAFFIDCWATWCSPCIEEFQYKESLKEYLNKHNIELVYISFDKKPGDAKWLNFIKKYNLKGYHMRSNEEFVNDFKRKAEYNGQLPTYLIVDKTGKIVEKNAFRPSNKQELFNQLKTKLNL